jgi:hypothetical protein
MGDVAQQRVLALPLFSHLRFSRFRELSLR